MKNTRLVLFLSILISVGGCGLDNETKKSIESAQSFMQKDDFSSALTILEGVEKEGIQNGKLFYNLGLCAYQDGKYGQAILYMEKANKWHVSSVKTNDIIFKAKARSNIEWKEVPQYFFIRWLRTVRDIFSADTWAILGLLISFLGAIAFYWSKHKAKHLKKARVLSIIFPILTILFLIFSYWRWIQETNPKSAITISSKENIILHSAPEDNTKVIRTFPTGTKIQLRDQLGEYYLIALPNLEEGWIKENMFCKI